jgi:hypothetical protein
VAAPDQRTPARRPVPVAADTPQAAAVSAVGQRRPDNGHGSASVVDIEHRGSRPVSRAGHCCSLRRTAPLTVRPPQTCRGHRSVRAPAAVLRPACQKQRDPLGCACQLGQGGRRAGGHPASEPVHTGRAFRTPCSPWNTQHSGRVRLQLRTLRQPSTASAADRRPCRPRSSPDGSVRRARGGTVRQRAEGGSPQQFRRHRTADPPGTAPLLRMHQALADQTDD